MLLRILLLGYLYGITSEWKLVEELHMHLAWHWFTGLGFEQEIPHHSDPTPENCTSLECEFSQNPGEENCDEGHAAQ
jgi:Transposase domain (DUF772)